MNGVAGEGRCGGTGSCLLLRRIFFFKILCYEVIVKQENYKRPTNHYSWQVRDAAAGQGPHRGQGFGMGGKEGEKGKRTELSSDDLVMERFKKRFCMKK